ncbi:hypothetical protein [Neoaquamicrobium sediminum]|uniref:hypothetical protein n=1 Tax=Neoaquamicrobium sediminum TaxID=1849104 RepID=UPI001563C8AE|nr:hypothetical protein [Mesorhizobium sediminum]NRC54168.1 hypothetical protein [Mesorhizobium sediminum]
MNEIPSVTVTVKNGDWPCKRCGKALGATNYRRGEGWKLSIPVDCYAPDQCAKEMLALLEPSKGMG